MDCLLLDMLEGEPCSGRCSQHASPRGRTEKVATSCGVMCYAKELEQEMAALEAEAQWDLAQEDTLDTLLSCDTGMACRGYCQASYPDESADSDDPECDEEGAEEDVEGGVSCAITANADAVATGRGALRVGAWRGCCKSPWCDREDRHRGLCNRKATIPGPASITGSHADTSSPPDTPLAALADAPFGLQHQQGVDSHPAAAAAAAATSDQVSAGHHSHNLMSVGSLGSDDTEVASALKTAPSDAPSSDMRRSGCAPLALLPHVLDALDDPPEPFWALPDPDCCYTGGSPLDDVEGMCDLQQHMQLQLEQQRHQQQQGSLALRQRAEEEALGLEASGSEAGTGLGSCHSSPQRPPLTAAPLLVASVAQKPLGTCLLLLPPTSLAGMCSSTRPSRPDALFLSPLAAQPELLPVAPQQLSTPPAATPAPCAPLPAAEPPASVVVTPVVEAPLAAAAPPPPAAAAAPAAQPMDVSSGTQCGSSEGGSGGRSLRPASARVPKRSLEVAVEEPVVVPVKKKPAHKSASAPHGHCCTQCGTSTTPVWRAGPAGPKTLCNACGVRFMKIAKRKA